LRVANVNPTSVVTYTDRVLYSAIGIFILLYFAYATVGGATFVDASSNYGHPWWRWLVGPLVALAVIAYDRAVVGRVAINYDNLDSEDPDDLLKKRTFGLYVGRALLALLVAVIVTEPLMLDRYRGEIDAYLNQVQNGQAENAQSVGAIKGYEAEKKKLGEQDAADDAAVDKLHKLAADKRAEAQKLYQQALDDSDGDGVTHKPGCPPGGYCDTLVQRSRALQKEAAGLDDQAAKLRASQQAGRDGRDTRRDELDKLIAGETQANLKAIKENAGFGARTKAMWHLVSSDFAGVGIFYLGTALLLIALDCAAIGLKLVSRGNAYERAEARVGRRRELEETVLHRHELRAAKAAADAYADATAAIVSEGIQAAADERRLRDTAAIHARSRLREAVNVSMRVDEESTGGGRRWFGAFRQRRPSRAESSGHSPWPTEEQPAPARDGYGRADADGHGGVDADRYGGVDADGYGPTSGGSDATTRRWSF
jgi:hypothetical protein